MNLRWLFFCCCCCTDVCTIILFSLFLFDIWPCFMYFGRCTFAWVSSVALFYHGWRRREMFNECFLRAPLWPLKRGDNFLVLIFIFLAQMTKKKETNVGLGVWKKINQTFFFYFIVALIENKLSLLFFNINCTKKERKKKSVRISLFNLTVVWHFLSILVQTAGLITSGWESSTSPRYGFLSLSMGCLIWVL